MISGVYFFQSMSHPGFVVRYQQKREYKGMLLFVDQPEAELNRTQFEKVEQLIVHPQTDGKSISMGKSNDFRKTGCQWTVIYDLRSESAPFTKRAKCSFIFSLKGTLRGSLSIVWEKES